MFPPTRFQNKAALGVPRDDGFLFSFLFLLCRDDFGRRLHRLYDGDNAQKQRRNHQ